jgi:hypothetical protein
MSLIQHVHPHEGTDREEALVDLFLPPLERQATVERQRRASIESGYQPSQRSIRRIISYDALKPPQETAAVEQPAGVTQYHVSAAKRLGEFGRLIPIRGDINKQQNANHCVQPRLLLQYSHVGSPAELCSVSLP